MSFIEFVNENESEELKFIKSAAHSLIQKIKSSRSMDVDDYVEFSGMEFTEPFLFDLILYVKRSSNSKTIHDNHFNDLPWEEINFKEKGYMIDANTKMNKKEMVVPRIEFHIILDPKREPSCYSNLYYRLIDILAHETNHLDQVGINRDHPNITVSTNAERKSAKKSNAYFLLPEEVESMVTGMYTRSIEEGRPLDVIFYEYLRPFVKSEYINVKEFEKTMKTWITHAIEKYPNAKFSSKADQIINSI